MDLEKNKQRLEIMAAELEELKRNGGGGGDLSDYLTKSEASSTYETQSAATASLALKADKATTYTKTEVDEAIASAGGNFSVIKKSPRVAFGGNFAPGTTNTDTISISKSEVPASNVIGIVGATSRTEGIIVAGFSLDGVDIFGDSEISYTLYNTTSNTVDNWTIDIYILVKS